MFVIFQCWNYSRIDRRHCTSLCMCIVINVNFVLFCRVCCQMSCVKGTGCVAWKVLVVWPVVLVSYVKGTGCVACCCIMTQDRIFMCYEDVQTNVVRTLSSLSIALLNAVFVDPENESCCVLVSASHSASVMLMITLGMCVKAKVCSDSVSKNRTVQKFDICSDGFPIETACNPLFI